MAFGYLAGDFIGNDAVFHINTRAPVLSNRTREMRNQSVTCDRNVIKLARAAPVLGEANNIKANVIASNVKIIYFVAYALNILREDF